ncbi:MAG: alpha/beta fold hydrolase [Spirochaetota bacterium]
MQLFQTSRLFTFLFLLFSLHCALSDSKFTPVEKSRRPVVFIHGHMGGNLVDDKGKKYWLSPAMGLGFSTPDVKLPIQWQGDRQKKDDLRPTGPIEEVAILWGMVGSNIYGNWMQAAKKFPDSQFYTFNYDWRRDNNETADQFAEFLQKVQKDHNDQSVQVVAHSMGGIITLAVWNENPDLIDKVVFAGVPFRGGLGYLDNLYLGTPIALNQKILSAEVFFTHPTAYAFFPSGLEYENKDLIVDADGKAIQVDYYNPTDWKRLGFGPYARQSKFSTVSPEQEQHLRNVLAQSKKFRARMQPKRETYKQALVISSKTHPTLSKVRQLTMQDGKKSLYDFDSELKVEGDGSVTRASMLPPKPIPYKEFLSKNAHSSLLNDEKVQRAIQEFFAEK